MEIFDRIEVAGVQAQKLPAVQDWYEGVTIRRLATETHAAGLSRKIKKAIGFGQALVREYRHAPLTCINCHSVAALPACLVLKRLTGAKLVYDTHELETETQGLTATKKMLYKAIERLGVRHIDHLVFVTASIEGWYRDRYGAIPATTIYNYPEQRLGLGERRSRYFHELYGLSETTRVFLYQGVIGEARGLRELLSVFSNPPRDDVMLVVLGYGPLENELRNAAASYPAVRFHDAVAPEVLADYTAAADFGTVLIGGSGQDLSLSYRYSGPNKLFQYIQAGLPVLASNLIEFSAVLDQYPVGVRVESVTVPTVSRGVAELATTGSAQFQDAIARAASELVWHRQQPLFEKLYLEDLHFRSAGGRDPGRQQ